MNPSARSSSDSKSTHRSAVALVLLISGLVVLGSQWALQNAAPVHGEQGWTDTEKREFRELQTVLHKSPAKARGSKQNVPVDQNQIFARMDALDALRLDRQNGLDSRDRWLRMIGTSLIGGGLMMYFKSKVASDER